MKYTLPEPDDLTLNDAFQIKASTQIDIFNPITIGHRNAALTWFASQSTDEPLKWKEVTAMSVRALSELIEEDDDEDEELPDELVEIPDPEAEDTGPKDSLTSTPRAWPAPGDVPQSISGPAPSGS